MREGHAGVTGIPWGARPWKPGRHAVRKPKRGHLRVFLLGALLRPSWATRILQAIPDSPSQTPRRCHEERKEGRHPRGALPGRRPTIRMKDSCGSEPRDSGCALYHRTARCHGNSQSLPSLILPASSFGSHVPSPVESIPKPAGVPSPAGLGLPESVGFSDRSW